MNEYPTPMRGIRRARAITLDDVSLQTGIDKGLLSRYERGYSRPSEDVQQALATFFGLPDFILFPPADAGQEKRT